MRERRKMLSAATARKSQKANRVFITYYKEGQKWTPFSYPVKKQCKIVIINKKKKKS